MINEESKKNYPTSWEVVKLGDFADSEKGKKPKNQQPSQDEEFNLPYIDIEAFEKGIFKSFTDGEKCVICDDSDFLMVWDGSRSGLVGKGIKGALGSTLIRINLPMINNLYGYYYLQSKYLEINTRAKGVGIPHVDPSLLWSYDFPIPPVNEQNRIVDKIEKLFSEVDAGIANLTLAKRQLEQYRQSLLKHAFEGKLTAKWREEYAEKHSKFLPSADELLEQIQAARQDYYDEQIADWEQAVKDWEEQGKKVRKPSKPTKPKELLVLDKSNLPNGWVVVEFEGICELIRNGLSLKPEGHEGTKILRISAVRAFSLNLDDYRYLSNEHEVSSFLLQQGDLLFTRYNGTRRYVGVCALFKSTEDYVYPDKLIRAVVNLDEIENSFLAYGLNAGVSRSFIERRIRTTAGQSGISGGDIKKMPVVLCSKQEQDIIVSTLDEKISETDSIISTLEGKILKANLLKTSILHKAFQGKLVPQNPNDPLASELLAQIKAEREAKALAEKQAKQEKAASKSKAKIKPAKTVKKSKKDEQITLPL
ncbi:restriction endonuclease subunit S [Psychrobacter immobilis]|uniref:restriction endonuclease subunit S n=1 Tax=Psychrobacter immobilis TaxID=498 RepID=UPI003FD06EA8